MHNLHKLFLLDPNIDFLNHGSFGATPKPVFDEYQRWQRELELKPVEFLDRRFEERMAISRAALSEFLGTLRDNLVYVVNATVGVNIVARSLDLNPGDEVLTTDHEYGACDRTWEFLAGKRGYSYKKQAIPIPVKSKDAFVEQLWKGVTPHTKVIYLSHITSPTATIFPVLEVCRRAREQGILTVVDGAHAPGQIHLSLEEVGADFYTGNLHKWLCNPKGAGFLYARPEVQDLLEPLVVSWGYESEKRGPSQFVDHHQWWGTRDIAAFLSVPAAIQFQAEHDWDSVRTACHDLAMKAETRICALTGLSSLYENDSWYAQMFVVQLPVEIELPTLKAKLYDEYQVEVPVVAWNDYKMIRVSVQGYNTQKNIQRLIGALEKSLNL